MAAPNLNAGQFTIGPNNSIAIYQGGSEVNIGVITTIKWNSKTRIEKKRVNLMSGYTFELPFLQGWEGTFEIQRTSNILEQFWYNQIEVPVRAGLPYPSLNIIQTLRETDGVTITRLTFQGAILYYDNAGDYENENAVTQSLSFSSPVRIVS
jgi:hypothetical protein